MDMARSLNLRPFQIANVQRANLCQSQFRDLAMSIRHAIDGAVVHQHVMAVHRAADVNLNVIDPRHDGLLDSGQRVLVSTSMIASVRDHRESMPGSRQIRSLGWPANQY